MQRALSQKLRGKKPHRELLAFLDSQLLRLGAPPSRNAWGRRAAQIRQQLLELLFRGHDPTLLEAQPRVEWRGVIDWPVAYASAAPLFCFGLLREFDLPDLVELCAPVPIHDSNRGPLRATKRR